MIAPRENYIKFKKNSDMISLYRTWGLPLRKELFYNGYYTESPVKCKVVGFILNMTTKERGIGRGSTDIDRSSIDDLASWAKKLVIQVNGQLHTVRVACLAEMQKKSFKK